MSDLVEFLRARLDEDEHLARACSGPSWSADQDRFFFPFAPMADAEHIARHDPARVLREVEAKRRIIGLHAGRHECQGWLEPREPGDTPQTDYVEDCQTLRLLASTSADHPDYQQEWAP